MARKKRRNAPISANADTLGNGRNLDVEPLEPGQVESSIELEDVTLAELGGELAHGLITDGGVIRSYTFKPPTLGTRKQLGAIRGNPELRKHPGKLLAHWLGAALSELCGVDMTALKEAEAGMVAARLTVGDFLLLLFAWNQASHPEGLPLALSGCGKCGHPFDNVNVDLGTLQVSRLPLEGVGYDSPPLARVGLKTGFPWKGDKVSAVLVRPPTWLGTYWTLSRQQWSNTELLTARIVRDCIVGTDVGGRPNDAALDHMWPADINLIDEGMAEIAPTPDLQVTVECPACGASNNDQLDWQSVGFLGAS